VKLVVSELKASGLIGEYTSAKNSIGYAVRPHLYRHNYASGSLKVEIYDESDVLLATSESIAIADIVGPNEDDFFHGYVSFQVNVGFKKDQTYKFKLVSEGGYTFNESAYIGWCSGFDLGKYPPTYTPTSSLNYPFDLEVWERIP
jgi:hypothetical protein